MDIELEIESVILAAREGHEPSANGLARAILAHLLAHLEAKEMVIVPKDGLDWLLDMAEDRGTTQEQSHLRKIRAMITCK